MPANKKVGSKAEDKSGGKPERKTEAMHACQYCDKKFRASSTRDAHHVKDHGATGHACPECGKVFADSCNLNRHRRNSHGKANKVWKCGGCGKDFRARGDNAKRHADNGKGACRSPPVSTTTQALEGLLADLEGQEVPVVEAPQPAAAAPFPAPAPVPAALPPLDPLLAFAQAFPAEHWAPEPMAATIGLPAGYMPAEELPAFTAVPLPGEEEQEEEGFFALAMWNAEQGQGQVQPLPQGELVFEEESIPQDFFLPGEQAFQPSHEVQPVDLFGDFFPGMDLPLPGDGTYGDFLDAEWQPNSMYYA